MFLYIATLPYTHLPFSRILVQTLAVVDVVAQRDDLFGNGRHLRRMLVVFEKSARPAGLSYRRPGRRPNILARESSAGHIRPGSLRCVPNSTLLRRCGAR